MNLILPFIGVMIISSLKPYMFIFSSIKNSQMVSSLTMLSMFMSLMMMLVMFFYSNHKESIYLNWLLTMALILMCSFFYSDSMILMLFFFETPIIPMSMILMKFGNDKEKLESTLFMLLMNLFGSISYMICLSMTMNFSVTSSMFFMSTMMFMFSVSSAMMFILFNLMFLLKLPILFMHFWLTKAHVSASGICSMILASIMLKMGAMGLMNLSILFCFINLLKEVFSIMFLSLMMVPMAMIRSMDLKYLVALSSISHMSIIPSSIYSMGSTGMHSFFLMITGHGVTSAMLFMYIAMFYEKYFNRSMDFMKSNESVDKITSFMFLSMLLVNFGMPPFVNFFSELMIMYLMLNLSLIMTVCICMFLLTVNIMVMFFISKFLMLKKITYVKMNLMMLIPYTFMISILILFGLFMMT